MKGSDMTASTASARRARTNTLTVKVYDMATGALVRETTTRGEIARVLAKYDAQLANGEMTKKAHANKVRALTAMLKKSQERDDERDDATVTATANKVRATRDYEGVWSDDMRGAFFASL
jgi:hypothetical protein